jgi:hypothetical protein
MYMYTWQGGWSGFCSGMQHTCQPSHVYYVAVCLLLLLLQLRQLLLPLLCTALQ